MMAPRFAEGSRVRVTRITCAHSACLPRTTVYVKRVEYRGLIEKPEWWYKLTNGMWYAESELSEDA
jgi:hypothetical protein